MNTEIRESDDSGQTYAVYESSRERVIRRDDPSLTPGSGHGWLNFLKDIFLPAGYPATVSQDYLQCQVYYGIQAFCSSLAGLIASRAVLEGHGIGRADASATDAMLLTVLQDAFSRLTTILGAYYLGTSLYPEAKTYRLVADIANDVAIVFDLLSPQLSHYSLVPAFPFVSRGPGSALRTSALCLSGAFRALCGVAAGGSRAALTIHFAQDGVVPGDVGDLSAKDASKETVLALFGMLLGSLIIPQLQTAESTYTVVCLLLIGHLVANYVAVRVVVMRPLNRQRTSLLWSAYREFTSKGTCCKKVLSRKDISNREYLFFRESALLRINSGTTTVTGHANIGSCLSDILHTQTPKQTTDWMYQLLKIFEKEKFIVWANLQKPTGFFTPTGPQVHVLLKEGHISSDHVKAWAFASDLAVAIEHLPTLDATAVIEKIQEVKKEFDGLYATFLVDIKREGWDVESSALVSGSPRVISVVEIDATSTAIEPKKTV